MTNRGDTGGDEGFVHLHVHSAYSLAEGALPLADLVSLCRRHAMPAVAVTDSGNLFGALEFARCAAAGGVQPIIGCHMPVDSRAALGGGAGSRADAAAVAKRPGALVLLAQSQAGYRNLLALTSAFFIEDLGSGPRRLALAALEGRTEGLIALTGGPEGDLSRAFASGRTEAAEAFIDRLKALFDDRLYVELQRHGSPGERAVEPALIEIADRHALPLVATNEAYFTDPDMYEAHDALLCIATSAYVSQADRRRVTPEHWFKSPAQMRALFADLPEACDNTLAIARRCGFMPEPRAPILPAFVSAGGISESEALRGAARDGLARRLAGQAHGAGPDEASRAEAARPYFERLDFELSIIEQMGFPGYFLIVADFIAWAKRAGIPVGPGRGSGAGSVVAWALGITGLDPLRWGLLFERFLNPARVSMPDFDIDFCQERRDEVLHYVRDKYGADRVAQIITFGKLQARAVVRDVGRVLEMPYGRVDRIATLIPNNPASPVSLGEAIEGEPQLQAMRDEDEGVAQLLDRALKLEGLYRNSSTHAAGVVIADRPLTELVPLYRDPRSDVLATQFNMKNVELAGLVKFDFLGLKTLSVLARAVQLIADGGRRIDLETIPLDDRDTYAMLARGETTGVFQCESAGVRDVLRTLRPDRFEDIIAVVALYRPGPMSNIPSYIRRKHGEEETEYLHPSLEPVLAETYGIPIYQEQVMRMAQVLAGFSLGHADLLRRAMGKKIRAEMEAQRKAFLDGAAARGVAPATAERIFLQIEKFAGYGFNKSHAAAYALVAYQTAYLKARFPVEFLAAAMTFDMHSTDRLALYRRELDRLGVPLLPPDINASGVDFTVETASAGAGEAPAGKAIRYALAAVRGAGRGAMEHIVAQRADGGPFTDLFDFAARIDPHTINRRQMETLVSAGAFDGFDASRARVFAAIDTLLAHAHAESDARRSGQTNLFGGEAGGIAATRLPEVEPWAHGETLQRELEAIGFYLSAHPLDEYGPIMERLGVTPAATLAEAVREAGGAATLTLAGTVLGLRLRRSQRGSRYAFVQFSDATAVFEATVFSEILSESQALLEGDAPLLVTVAARIEDDRVRLVVQGVALLERAAARVTIGLRVRVADPTPLAGLKRLLTPQRADARADDGPRGPISLMVAAGDREIEVGLGEGYSCSPAMRAALRAVPGVIDVETV